MDMRNIQKIASVQKQFQKIKEDMENTHVEAEHKGLVLTFDGGMNLLNVDFESDETVGNKELTAEAVKVCFGKANKKIQEMSMERMSALIKKSGIDPSALGMGSES